MPGPVAPGRSAAREPPAPVRVRPGNSLTDEPGRDMLDPCDGGPRDSGPDAVHGRVPTGHAGGCARIRRRGDRRIGRDLSRATGHGGRGGQTAVRTLPPAAAAHSTSSRWYSASSCGVREPPERRHRSRIAALTSAAERADTDDDIGDMPTRLRPRAAPSTPSAAGYASHPSPISLTPLSRRCARHPPVAGLSPGPAPGNAARRAAPTRADGPRSGPRSPERPHPRPRPGRHPP